MQVKRIAECSKDGNILQYFRPSLSYHLSLRSLFCIFWSGRFKQVLLYYPLVRLLKYPPLLHCTIQRARFIDDTSLVQSSLKHLISIFYQLFMQ